MWSRQHSDDRRPSAVIAEDENALYEELRDMLARLWPELEIVGHARHGREALRLVEEMQPDIVFLDIRIPEPDGIDVARQVGERCHLVFVTAYDEYAITAFEAGAVDYVLKPVVEARLAVTVRRLREKLNQAPDSLLGLFSQLQSLQQNRRHMRWLTAAVGKTLRMIMVDDVIYFQSDQKYTRVVLADSEVLIKTPLKDLLVELDPDQFWQIHRSTVVNSMEIAAIEPGMSGRLSIQLKSRRERLPVSDSFMRRFRTM